MCSQNQIVIFLALAIITLCAGLEHINSYPGAVAPPSTVKKSSYGAWFSPRMGRRLKRNPKEEMGPGAMYLNSNRDEFNSLAEYLQENPWAILTSIPESQKRQMNFTPRLGRDSGEENSLTDGSSANTDRWLQESELALNSGDLMTQRSPPFVPRLGRRFLLGRSA